ncbi:MAG: GGDEF domain-containing protein [Chromatiales bacterium]|jgi:diguanylate cyclase (GGDEF)-like protein|nr:GGDEF domain-containing protein [Chromatiales bacterium]
MKALFVEQLAMTDQLTGLMNRRALNENFTRLASRARLHGTPISFIMMDIEHFKVINDENGHAAGDEVLASGGGYRAPAGQP